MEFKSLGVALVLSKEKMTKMFPHILNGIRKGTKPPEKCVLYSIVSSIAQYGKWFKCCSFLSLVTHNFLQYLGCSLWNTTLLNRGIEIIYKTKTQTNHPQRHQWTTVKVFLFLTQKYKLDWTKNAAGKDSF